MMSQASIAALILIVSAGFAAVRDVGEGVVLAAAVLAALVYIIKGIRAIARTADQLLKDIPERLDSIEKQAVEDREEHKSAHAEMLSNVSTLTVRVEQLAGGLARIEAKRDQDHEHLRAVTRELDVPVRGEHPPAA